MTFLRVMEMKQTQKINHGSFQNRLMGNNSTEPKVGEGMTKLMYSDRIPYEVIEVSDDKKSVIVRKMNYEPVGENLGMGHESWKVSPNEDAPLELIEWFRGKWREVWFEEEYKNPRFWNVYWEMKEKISPAAAKAYKEKAKLVVKKRRSPISVIWGRAEYHYDWSF